MDFSLKTYINILNTLKNQGFSFSTFSDFISNPSEKFIVLRYDVDRLPLNSLEFARIQAELGIKGTYYFRSVKESWDEEIIRKIAELGHEVGYHYEDLSITSAKLKEEGGRQKAEGEELEKKLADIGIESFKHNLDRLRKIVQVNTICMHGSPMSRWDSRLLWKYYDYHDFGIIGEPYFDIDFNEVMYLTDTGRRWDGDSYNIRDKAVGGRRLAVGDRDIETERRRDEETKGQRDEETKGRRDEETKGQRDEEMKRQRDEETIISPSVSQSLNPSVSQSLSPSPLSPQPFSRTPFPRFHSTFDIIRAAEQGRLPDKIMMTFHPQRWTDKPVPWVKELVWQNVKNVGKFFVIKMRNDGGTKRRSDEVTERRRD